MVFPLSDRYNIFTSNWPWIEICENVVLSKIDVTMKTGLSAGTGKLCTFGHLGLVFIWSCFVSRLLFLLYYVICAPVLTEGTMNSKQ